MSTLNFLKTEWLSSCRNEKNDQHRECHSSDIKRSNKSTCPVSFTEKLLSLLPVEEGPPFPVLRRIVQKKRQKTISS